MSLIISVVVICIIIGLALMIQYFVKSSPNNPLYEPTLESFAMIVRIEPWYTSGGAKNKWNYGSIDDRSNVLQLKCSGVDGNTGYTPIGLFQSAIKDFSKNIPKEQRLFLFTGDIFSQGDDPNVDIDKTVMNKIFDKDEGLLNYFNPSNIFYASGNHGARIQQALREKDTVSEAWTQSIVNSGVYKPSGLDDIFWDTGYYKKLIPNTTIYIICFNSYLYSGLSKRSGCTVDTCTKKQIKQIDQLKKDLDSLGPNNSVYILTHYPIDSVSTQHFIWSKIGKEYKKLVSGIITGHTHTKLQNLDSWDSKKGKAYTWNIPSMYWDGGVSSYIKIPFPLNKPIELSDPDVMKIVCKDGQSTDSIQWDN